MWEKSKKLVNNKNFKFLFLRNFKNLRGKKNSGDLLISNFENLKKSQKSKFCKFVAKSQIFRKIAKFQFFGPKIILPPNFRNSQFRFLKLQLAPKIKFNYLQNLLSHSHKPSK